MLATARGHYNGTNIVFDTPVSFQKGQEVIVTYTILPKQETKTTSIVDSLIGAIPDHEKTLEQYREERLEKYACAD